MKFIVEVITPGDSPFDVEDMELILHNGMTEEYGWRCWNNGYSYYVNEKK